MNTPSYQRCVKDTHLGFRRYAIASVLGLSTKATNLIPCFYDRLPDVLDISRNVGNIGVSAGFGAIAGDRAGHYYTTWQHNRGLIATPTTTSVAMLAGGLAIGLAANSVSETEMGVDLFARHIFGPDTQPRLRDLVVGTITSCVTAVTVPKRIIHADRVADPADIDRTG